MARTYALRFADGTVLRDLFSSNLHHLASQGRLDLEDEVCPAGSDVWFPAWKVNGLFEEPVLLEFRNRTEALERLRNARAKGRMDLEEYRQERDSLLLLQDGAIRNTKWASRPRGDKRLLEEPEPQQREPARQARHVTHAAPERAGGVVDTSEPGSGTLAGADEILVLDDPLDLASYLRNYLAPQALWGGFDRVTAGFVVAVIPVLCVLDVIQPLVDGVVALLLCLGSLLVFTSAVAAFSLKRRGAWGAWIAPLFWGTAVTAVFLLVQLSLGPTRGVIVRLAPSMRRIQDEILGVSRSSPTQDRAGAGSR